MISDQLKILLQEGEGTMLEYKEGLSTSFSRERVAMANTLGGRILIGVRDNGSVVGINDSNDLQARIQLMILDWQGFGPVWRSCPGSCA